MRITLKRPPLAALLTIVIVTAADQVVKVLVVANADRLPDSLIGPVKLEILHNTGVSFSLFAGSSGLTIALVTLVIVVVVVLLVTLPRAYAIPISLILAGSIANLIDRIRWGYVLDYVAVGGWPRFNLADMAIDLGAALVVLVAIIRATRSGTPKPGGAEGADAGSTPAPGPGEVPPPAESSRPDESDGAAGKDA